MQPHHSETDYYYVAKHDNNMQWVHIFLEIIVIWITIGNVSTFKIKGFSKIMTTGGSPGQNQNYQINQIDDNFFLTTMIPPSAVPLPTTSTIGITVNETVMLTALPPPISTSTLANVVTESLTTTYQSTIGTDSPTNTDQISETQDGITATVEIKLSTSVVDSSTTTPNPKPTMPTLSSTSVATTTATATPSTDSTPTMSNLASTTFTTINVATNTTSTLQITETSTEIDNLDSSPTEAVVVSDSSDVIVFPDEDNTVSEKHVTFPPLIYQLISSQAAGIEYAGPRFVFPSEIKIYLNLPNSTIVVPGIIQANTDAQVNKATAKEVPNKDSFDRAPQGKEDNFTNKSTSSTEKPVRKVHNEEHRSGEEIPKREYSNREAPSIQTSNDEARNKKMHDLAVPDTEILTSQTPPSTETLSTPQITTSILAPNIEAASTQTQSTDLDTGILIMLTSSTETTSTQTELEININDFVDIFEENVDLSDKTLNNDFGQKTDQSAGRTSIHKIKCDEYSSLHKKSENIPRQKNNLPFQMFIVGGVPSEEKEFPHMAALGYGKGEEKQWLCGGSLISEKFILTAAHCLTSKEIGDVQIIRLGTTTLQTETLESMDYGVFRKIPHPLYVADQQYNDIALIELDRTVKFTEFILPACLDDSNDYTGRKLIATGWGRLQATGSVSKDLQKVDLDYFPHEICQQKYSKVSKQDLPHGIDRQTQICAGSETEVKDSCQGDSGGPLEEKRLGRNYIVGITSFGIGCGTPGIPGVYTKVSYYIPWIESMVWSFLG